MRPFTSTPTVGDDPLASSDEPRHAVSLSSALREQAAHTWYRVQRCWEGTNRTNTPARYDSRRNEAGTIVTAAPDARFAFSSLVGADRWVIATLLAMLGLGSTLVNTPMAAAVPRLIPPERLASGQSITNMLFFLGGSLGATLTTAMLSARAAATNGFNPVHDGAGVGFSDAFLLLMVPVILALALSAAVPGRVVRESRETALAAASTAPLAEPSASS